MTPSQPPSSGTTQMLRRDASEMDPSVRRFVQRIGILLLVLIVGATIGLRAADKLDLLTLTALTIFGVMAIAMVRPRLALKIVPGLGSLLAKVVPTGLLRSSSGESRVEDSGPPAGRPDRRSGA